ncbi:hypothetical protein CKO_04162 [Citrobacter koseri ATCC BAA-895]|uniref:Uncharacterized protein n=1 Tax=Citrobacter koseri (strain ATCC BAA-895 / CDC 4225-83 / SGSC4696) TaxID=290338 RepID=A8AP14_CITK8|nr:hypothetical protein CKO_04162 [Citrobacter koseri ATCC BAA-895]
MRHFFARWRKLTGPTISHFVGRISEAPSGNVSELL